MDRSCLHKPRPFKTASRGGEFPHAALIHLLLILAALRPKPAATSGEGQFLLFRDQVGSADSLNLCDVGHAYLWQASFAFRHTRLKIQGVAEVRGDGDDDNCIQMIKC